MKILSHVIGCSRVQSARVGACALKEARAASDLWLGLTIITFICGLRSNILSLTHGTRL